MAPRPTVVIGSLKIGDDHLHLAKALPYCCAAGLTTPAPLGGFLIFGESITTDGLSLQCATALSLDDWAQAVEMISGLSAASPFWLGDLLAMGERAYGEKYAQGIPEGLSPTTLRGYQWVSERVPPANRRPGLSWSHHRAVSALPPVEQASLLDQAEAEGWSVAELGCRVKGQEAPGKQKAYKGRLIRQSYGASSSLLFDSDDAAAIVEDIAHGRKVKVELA